ncbi:MAG: hypothetical protein PWQ25_1464 [Deferribacteres bacterium]|nr:hypothetical protein [Deferribacteres bacterium]
MASQNYKTFGCSAYILPGGKKLYGFWLEEVSTGNSELLCVTPERFYRVTHIDVLKEINFILQCVKCDNYKCRHNPKYSKNAKYKFQPVIIKESAFEKRMQPRINIILNANVLPLSDLDFNNDWEKYYPAKITNISSKGCCLEFDETLEDIIPDIQDNVEIRFKNDIYMRMPDDTQSVYIYKLSQVSPIIGEVMWRMHYKCGVQFIIAKNSDIKMITDFVEEVRTFKCNL